MNSTISGTGKQQATAFLVEVALVVGAYLVYSLSKDLIHDNPALVAFSNARDIVNLEIVLGIYYEPLVQEWFLKNARAAVYLLNWFYTVGYWPVILPAAAVLWWRNRASYIRIRNIAFIAFGIVLVIYAQYPLAPPRMMPGFLDTLRYLGPEAFQHTSDALLANPFAAMPSVHYGLALLVSLPLIQAQSPWIKLVGLSYQGLMSLTVVVTGNHYFLDILAAMAVIGVAFLSYAAFSSFRRLFFTNFRESRL